jgi:protein involved in polysaccharide export with SLBB domain
MLRGTLSKTALGLAAVAALGGLEYLPAFATAGNKGEISEPLAVSMAALTGGVDKQFTLSNLASYPVDTTLSASALTAPALTGRFRSKDACTQNADESDLAVAGDSISIRIFENSAAGSDRFERRDLSGTFVVESGGQLAVPGIGRIEAADRSPACLEEPISTALSKAMGIDATVTAFYVSRPPLIVQGTVIAPGSYDFSPNLTVGALLAKAGAGGGTADTALRRTLSARRAELRILRAGLVLDHARLVAQQTGAKTITLPDAVAQETRDLVGAARIEGEAAVLQAATAERELRGARDAATREDLERMTKMGAARQAILRARHESLSRIRDEIHAEVGGNCRGGCSATRRYDEQRLDGFNNRVADLDIDLQDAQFSLIEAQHALERHDRAVELARAEADTAIARAVALALTERGALDAQIVSIEAQLGIIGGTPDRVASVERRRGGEIYSFAGSDTFRLLPGDLVTVGIPGEGAATVVADITQ